MATLEKLTGQAAKILDEHVMAATMVVPPGATLYRAFSRGSPLWSEAVIAQAIGSKLHRPTDEITMANKLPSQMGILGITAGRVFFCKKRLVGVGCRALLADWVRSDVSISHHDENRWKYPSLVLAFSDGSSCAVFGERRWQLDALATVSG